MNGDLTSTPTPALVSLTAGEWSALGVWVTIVVYIALAVFAYRQVKEARNLRIAQARPFVLVGVHFRSFLILISIKNIGKTAARDVMVKFDSQLVSASGDPDWEHSSAFTDGIPSMAPDHELRFFLDTYHGRTDMGLPMLISGTVSYSGPSDHGQNPYNEPFKIDLNNYEGAQLPESGMPELVDEMEKVVKEMRKWTNGIRGLQVTVTEPPEPKRSTGPPQS